MNSTFKQKKHLLELKTPLGNDTLILTSFKGTEGVSQLFQFHLDLFSENASLSAKQLLGQPVSFHINGTQGIIRHFHGIINRFYIGTLNSNLGRYYRAEVVPSLWLLTRSIDCQIFQNSTTEEIFNQLFKKFDINDYTISGIKNTLKKRPYCVQYRETAFAFISRLMEEEGIYYYFQHEKDKHILVLTDTLDTFKNCEPKEILYPAENSEISPITHWEQQFNYGSGKWTKTCYDFERPSSNLLKSTSSLVNISNITKYECYEYSGSYDEAHDTAEQSKFLMESSDAQHQIIQGISYYPHFVPGIKFKATQDKSAEKNYALLQVEHEAHDTTYTPGEQSRQFYKNSFTCIPDTIIHRPMRITPKPVMQGLQTALVVGPPGEEVYTDKYGRIKVQFYWDRQGKKDDKSSCWIRISQAWTGKQWGSIYIPRIGQEVIVSFLEGDPDQPIIIGSVYNAEQMPPYTLPDNKTQSGIKSNSSKQGGQNEANELRFEDKKGDEAVYFHAQKDFYRVVEHDDTLEVKNNQTIKIKKDRETVVEEGNEKYTISKGSRDLSIVTGNNTENIKNNYSVTVESGNRSVAINSGNDSLTIKQGNQVTKLDTGKSLLEAMQSIELKVGSNSVTIDQSGITLKGIKISLSSTLTDIKANASLKLEGTITEVTANGMLKIQGSLTTIN